LLLSAASPSFFFLSTGCLYLVRLLCSVASATTAAALGGLASLWPYITGEAKNPYF